MHKPSHSNPSIFETHYEQFQEAVIDVSRETPVLVDFWADWCGPCHALSPHLERVVEEREGGILLAKLEVDEGENMRLAGHYRVRGFPTVILLQHGEEKGRFSGARSRYQINEWLQEHLD
ncbi:thioredoxin family protein [Imhoffiella purpurea]|uniref:Thioredoxin n=1 Tax=Imhoffiella purpurea TaxID=1249627 RepID=W9W3L9_9GAMM|nr:thioredoxin family protein [Imhoffiella purpurea]EXJ17160.1 Thioredoxin domain protein [Imhoffiella purpurea]